MWWGSGSRSCLGREWSVISKDIAMPIPPQSEIELSLLEELIAVGGSAEPPDMYQRLSERYFLTEGDLAELTEDRSESRWQNTVRFVRLALVEKGFLHREPRGVWRITEQGRKEVRDIEAAVEEENKTWRELLFGG